MQKELPLIGRLNGPAIAPREYVRLCNNYREAVALSWQLRRVKGMTKAQLAAEADLYASHVNDYLSTTAAKRDLPASAIARFEAAVGNTLVSQWIAKQANLTVLEELQVREAA